MHRLGTAIVVLCALTAGVLLTSTRPALAQTPATTSAAPACTGSAPNDARVAGCGIEVGSTPVTFTWPHDAVAIQTALASPRLTFRGAAPADAHAIDFVTVWQRDEATGGWRSWSTMPVGPYATLTTFERGATYILVARTGFDLSLAPIRSSTFTGTRIVSLYGHPGVATMGALGTYSSAEAAAIAVEELAQQYAALSGTTRVVPALHLIVSVAQADPGWDGTYLGRMSLAEIAPYVEATRARGQLLFLDVQVGWGDPLDEVGRLEPLLREPHVHLALDPEFATQGKNEPPGGAIGYLTADQVNAVQRALLGIARSAQLASKVLVLHQFRGDMLRDTDRFERIDGVDVVIDMDGWGDATQKLDGYEAFGRAAYAEYAALKLFIHWDQPLLTPAQVMALPDPPDYVIYQ